MEWYDFLIEERARKLNSIEQLSSGKVTISVNRQDVSQETIADYHRHIAEIESILSAAGQSYDG